jgi:hypothetical protein
MFEWLFLLFTPVVPDADTPKKDYVGVVAAEAAYSALLSSSTPVKPKPIDPNCPTCHGTGKVKSGDGISWTKCPTCQPMTMVAPPQPSMKLQTRPLAPVKTSACPDGNCPPYRG